MKIPLLFKEYIWLVNTIYQAEKIKFSRRNVLTFVNEITEKCRKGIFS